MTHSDLGKLSRYLWTILGAWILIAIGSSPLALSQNTQNTNSESWLGTLNVGAVKLRLQLNLKQDDDGNYSGEMVSLDQSPLGIKMDSVTKNENQLEFEIKRIGASFVGKLDADQSMASGKFKQGQEFDVEFKRVEGEVKAERHLQTWSGTLKAGSAEFVFQFRVFENAAGEKRVKLDSFSEGQMGIPAEFARDEDEIAITIPMTKAKFVGTLSDDKQSIDGNWLQGGGTFPLKLSVVPLTQTRDLNLNRPQTPKGPFDYVVSEFFVAVNSVDAKYSADVELAGTMTSPRGAGPFATVILISGSGPQDRDETIFEHKPFWVLADHLTKKGFAVIRFDERGVGESKGPFATSTSADFADDVEALIGWAKTQSKVDGKKIVLAGHSEGGLVAPMIASRNKDVAGVIMLAGPGVSGTQIIMNQTRKIAAASGAPKELLGMQDRMLRRLLSHLNNGKPITDSFKQSLQAEFDQLTDQQKSEFQIDGVADKSIAMMQSPWMRYFLKYDPTAALKNTTCPILSVIGGNDLQVDPELNLPAIKMATRAGKNPDFVQKELPGLNHLFQKSETGAPSEYVKIEQTLDPSLLNEVTQWLEQRFK